MGADHLGPQGQPRSSPFLGRDAASRPRACANAAALPSAIGRGMPAADRCRAKAGFIVRRGNPQLHSFECRFVEGPTTGDAHDRRQPPGTRRPVASVRSGPTKFPALRCRARKLDGEEQFRSRCQRPSVGPISRSSRAPDRRICKRATASTSRSSRFRGVTRPTARRRKPGSIPNGGHEPIGVDAVAGDEQLRGPDSGSCWDQR